MREGWEQYRFDEVFNLQMGKTPDRKTPQYFGGDNVWVSIRDLVKKEIFDSNEHITDEAILASNIRQVKKGTVIMSFKLTVGKCAIAGKDLYTNEAIIAFNLKEGYEIIPNFLYYYLQGYKWEGANKAVMGLTLNKATISKHKIAFPPLSTQQSIVSELDKINELISLKKSQLEDLDSLAQSIFYDMFGDFEDDTPLSHFINSLGGGKSLAGMVPCINKVLKTGAVTYDCFDGNAVKDLPIDYVPLPEHLLKNGDLLVSRMNSPELVGSCAYVWKAPANTYLPDRLWRAELKQGNNPIYLWFSIIQLKAKEQIRTLASGTSGSMKNISKPRFLSVKIKNVPLSLQQSFAKRIEVIEQQKQQINKTIKDLETLLASRMQYWFD